RVAQRAVSDSDRDAADDIVDDLVPDQDAQRVGARVPADLQSDHGIIGADFPILGSGLEKRLVDGRDTVLRRASRQDFVPANPRLAEVRFTPTLPLPECRISVGNRTDGSWQQAETQQQRRQAARRPASGCCTREDWGVHFRASPAPPCPYELASWR